MNVFQQVHSMCVRARVCVCVCVCGKKENYITTQTR